MTDRIDRRRFGALIAGGAAAMPTLAPALGHAQAAKSPQKGGRLRIVVQETSSATVLDPAKVASWTVYFAYELCGGRLVGVDSSLRPVPELAESFEPLDGDVRQWVFKLRRGVQFSNGKSIEAADVIYTVNRIRDAANNIPVRNLTLHIEDIVAEDRHTIRFRLSRPDADFPILFASTRFVIFPEDHVAFDRPVGAGPFVGDTLNPSGQNLFRRNPNYWRSEAPHLDEVLFFGNQDAVARVSALLAGDVDAVQTINFGLTERIERTRGYQVIKSPSGVHNVIAMHVDRPPFDKLEVRQAMLSLINRPLMRDRICLGFADIGNDHPIPPLSAYYHSELPLRTYDPDRARSLLSRAGVTLPPLTLQASDAVTPGVAVDLAQMFADNARAAGVTVQARREPVAGYWDNVWLKQPLVMGGWGTRVTPDGMFRVAYHSSARQNETRLNRPDIDKLIDDGVATSDVARRRQIYWDIQEIVHREGGSGIPLFFNQLDAISDRVKGTRPSPLGALAGYNLADVWLDRS